jgi:hypothetical protein
MSNTTEVRARISKALLEELKQDVFNWYYISIADNKAFWGGYIIKARGPTEAWCLMHSMNWYPKGSECGTQTTEIPDITKVPEDMRWRKLTQEDLNRLK